MALIQKINPIIKGWCNYFSSVISKKVYEKLWHLVVWKLRKWGRHRHRNKGRKWIRDKYLNDNWGLETQGEYPISLIKHSSTKIKRYVKIKGKASPYDGDWIYWSTRMQSHPEVPKRVAILLSQQKGKCAHCNNYFRDSDTMEVDHITPKSQGKRENYNNWQLLHRHCHDKKTNFDGSLGNKSSCNSAKPKPPVKSDSWIWIHDMLVTTY